MSIVNQLFPFVSKYKKRFIIGIVILIGAVGFELLGPLVAMYIIDHYVKTSAAQIIQLRPVLLLLSLFFVVSLIHAILSYFQTLVLQRAGSDVIKELRIKLFEHVQKLPIKYFDNLPAGKVVARITNDTQMILELFTVILPNFISAFITMIGVIIAIFFINTKIGLIALVTIPFVMLWLLWYKKVTGKYNYVIREKNSDMNALINESINGMNIIQAFKQEKQIMDDFDEMNQAYLNNYKKIIQFDSLTEHNLLSTIRSIVFLMLIVVFGTQFLNSSVAISVGTLYILVNYITRLFDPLFGVLNVLGQLEQARVSCVRVFEMMNVSEEKMPEHQVQLPEKIEGTVHFKDVSFAYNEGEYVLENINLEVDKGQTIALVGHTGSGKSSIMNLLFRFYDPTVGTIEIDGIPTIKTEKRDMRKHMGIVLQDPYLYTGTILSNITLDDPKVTREKAVESLNAVGGDRVLEHFKKGIDEPVIERGRTLSSGQRQIISFARALAFDPEILILDEATSSIDSETEEIIQKAMTVLSKGRTSFIIAHRLSTIKNADQIIVLDKGRIIEKGNHDELIKSEGQYYKMYQMQSLTD
ncbi:MULTISPECIES: ABC transporter ATP-binding protein [Mammaliicoccus]|uniref:ABC transporter ATP-binding protein n=1 Tax=Mammaliicoccus sciuri TaxID=1296 RepID=A0A1C9LUQ6_MAMSC|nr:ABC transporter ATP-binding protein [Mammaliicoccus sciuri]AOQ25952.1 ABC transporter ATP-binding protein [Mammaliicoccus sciuri]AVE17207.1 MdlB-1 [Mammaliicoccus sciuri]AVE17223.1 MdlB-1 [Mammaliicoccus sciuri]KTT83600.1 ABC transporter ATP-binding protein [Mammaliicoccus sciuri]MBA1396714.1 ATP-binding cassette domain-containing protein [Mammaliicoccus sciuri]